MKSPIALALALMIAAGGTASAQNDRIVADVVYGHKLGMALTLDVFKPDGDANGAGILYMVSGGWVSRWSPPERAVRRFQALLDSGFTVFAVRHGSSPRFKVPEAVEDVQKALQFVHANAADFGVDPDRLGVHGGSAGGHLSLMLGLAPAGSSENSPSGLIAAVVAYFPPVDIRQSVGPSRRFPALDFEPSQAPSISPILFASADDPPTLLVHGTADTLVPIRNSETMLAALQEQKVPVELLVLEGAGHGFRGDDGQRASEALVAWFEKYLSPEKE